MSHGGISLIEYQVASYSDKLQQLHYIDYSVQGAKKSISLGSSILSFLIPLFGYDYPNQQYNHARYGHQLLFDSDIQMENDISVEDIRQYNTQKEEQLLKMKKNIEAMSLNMAKKKMLQTNKPIETISIHDHLSSFNTNPNSPINQPKTEQFPYNSTLFRNIDNDSQPIINNGSAVSNFSSVSNINHILNNHLTNNFNPTESTLSPVRKDPLMDNIDKVLQRAQKHLPSKNYQQMIQSKAYVSDKSVIPEESASNSKITNKSGELSARTKLQEYRQLISKLDTIEEEKNFKDTKRTGQVSQREELPLKFPKPLQYPQEELQSYRYHSKEPSNLTYKSDYPGSLTESKFPPTPPAQPKKLKPSNAVQRQKQLIKQSMLQYKKLQTEASHDLLDKSEIDFQLSDDEADQKGNKNYGKKVQLLREKEELEIELKRIEEELNQLERL